MLGITPEYLCTVFKKSTGETVMRFVNRLKLNGVRSLMESERVPLYNAAEHFGFSDPNYVSRLYVKLFGECITGDIRN
jgi:AraC-like DNA-binding protein